jgi:hypothetical protein
MTPCTKTTHSFFMLRVGARCSCGLMEYCANEEDEFIAVHVDAKNRLHVEKIESSSWPIFKAEWEAFAASHRVVEESLKFQRNLYYSLSGSTGQGEKGKEFLEDGKKLEESYVGFIVWKEG